MINGDRMFSREKDEHSFSVKNGIWALYCSSSPSRRIYTTESRWKEVDTDSRVQYRIRIFSVCIIDSKQRPFLDIREPCRTVQKRLRFNS
jgi:hypothetical protein